MRIRKLHIYAFQAGFLAVLLGASASAFAATLYVIPAGGATSGSCPIGTPCTLSRALTAVAAGDTVVLDAGTYSESSITLSGANHRDITVTTTDAVKAALTFSRGIASGTDNRPYFSAADISISGLATGVTLEYLRIRGGSAPAHWTGGSIIDVGAPGTVIQNVEVWNGGYGVFLKSYGPITLRQYNCHDLGPLQDQEDEHCVYSRTTTRENSGWSEQYLIEEATLGPNVSGDGIQPGGSAQYEGHNDPYWEIKNVDFLGPFDEQCIDSKGADYVKIHGIDCVKNFDAVYDPLTTKRTGYESTSIGSGIDTVYGSGAAYTSNIYWWIWDNQFHGNPLAAVYIGGISGNWYFWNNRIYDNAWACPYTGNATKAVQLPDDSYFIGNVVARNKYHANSEDGSNCNISGLNPGNSGDNVKNNILFDNATRVGTDYGNIRDYGSEDTGTPGYNYVYPDCTGFANCQIGANAITTSNPGLVSALAPYDWRLLSDSVNKDAGIAVSEVVVGGFSTTFVNDAAGIARPQGSGWDLGAFEYVSGTPDTTPPEAPSGLGVQ